MFVLAWIAGLLQIPVDFDSRVYVDVLCVCVCLLLCCYLPSGLCVCACVVCCVFCVAIGPAYYCYVFLIKCVVSQAHGHLLSPQFVIEKLRLLVDHVWQSCIIRVCLETT